jgi:hypothetical protein
MKRLAAAGILAMIALPGSPALALDEAPRKGSPQPGVCAEPVVSREYTTEAMVYRLTVDLHGCDWWDGSPLTLVAFMTRDDGQSEEFAFAPQACSAELGEDDSDGRFDKVGCEVSVSVEHPAVEVAHYAGAVSHVWQDGPQSASFDTTCVSSAAGAACRDDCAPAARAPGVHT